jgi:OFA family oxalate/formate antiporter-like MFS transporter
MVISSVVPLAVEKGVPLAAATVGMGVYAVANGLGRMVFAGLHDHVGRKTAMMTNSILMGGGLLGLVFLFDLLGYSGLIVSLVMIGPAYGGNVPQAALLTDSFFGPKHFPRNYGFFTIPAGIVASFAGPFVGSLLREASGSYIPGIIAAAALTIISVVISLSIRAPEKRCD